MRLFRKVAIIGVGLIGGSMGLAIKKKRLADSVVGVSRHKQSIAEARKINAVCAGAQNINIIKGADLVVLATPVEIILTLAPAISKLISRDCLVTDVGSTKEAIVSRLEKIFPNYVGSHPLAGSQKRGVGNADSRIFRDSLCILTPTKNTSKPSLYKLKALWGELGARVVLLSPRMHDKILSFTSHLPHIVAFSLIGAVPEASLKFSSSGLKDTTRIAASDAGLWRDIFLSNRRNVSGAINAFRDNLDKIKSAIDRKDKKALTRMLKAAQAKREILR